MVSRCAGKPGVPARTSRKGASSRTDWLAFSKILPTAASRVCASSTSTASGLARQRAISRAFKLAGVFADVSHSTEPTVETPTLRGRSFARPRRGANTSTSALSVGISSGVNATTSAAGSAFRASCLNQLSSTVLPLPRGPIMTTSCGGEVPDAKSAKHRRSTFCSAARPVNTGGVAPLPGVNRRCRGSGIGGLWHRAGALRRRCKRCKESWLTAPGTVPS